MIAIGNGNFSNYLAWLVCKVNLLQCVTCNKVRKLQLKVILPLKKINKKIIVLFV